MKNWILYSLVVIIIAGITSVYVAFADGGSQNIRNIEFLRSYGWEASGNYIEKVQVTLPDEMDDVYENYNKLQLKAGLDITPYLGKTCTRYTYEIKNYPEDVGETVRANLLCYEKTIISGDIMTVSLGGFMISLADT